MLRMLGIAIAVPRTIVIITAMASAPFAYVYFGPQFYEGVDGNCAAVEMAARRTTPTPFVGSSNGRIAFAIAKQKAPDLPPSVTCALTYWGRAGE